MKCACDLGSTTPITAAVACAFVPAKVVFALGGGVVSGVVYVATLGSSEPARSIWDVSMDGDYLVTPLMIEGRDSVGFVGG